jgi:hypothetical protein
MRCGVVYFRGWDGGQIDDDCSERHIGELLIYL